MDARNDKIAINHMEEIREMGNNVDIYGSSIHRVHPAAQSASTPELYTLNLDQLNVEELVRILDAANKILRGLI